MTKILAALQKLVGMSEIAPNTGVKQITLSFESSAYEALAALRKQGNYPSDVEAIRRSLTMLSVILEHFEEGGKVFFQGAEGTKHELKPESVKAKTP